MEVHMAKRGQVSVPLEPDLREFVAERADFLRLQHGS
jgi:hypothetical protein